MAIGRPISLTPNIATKNISSVATADQTEFTVTGGYRINEIAVYRNGVRLAEGRDFTASDGDTVNLVTGATVDDVIEFAVFDSFNVSDAIVSAASSQNLNGDFNVTGTLYAGTFEPGQFVAGIVTANTALYVGSALTANAAGDVETIGIITAASFSGDGSALTGLANTDYIVSVATTTGDLKVGAAVTVGGIVNIDATTDSTSTSTGALIVDGGLAVAKNVYIGAGLSVAGTLTYEDVTSVDSVGMVTAKSGVNITGGQLQVGVAYSVGAAGIVTAAGGSFTGDVDIADKIIHTGDTNTAIRFPSADTFTVETGGTERLRVESGGGVVIGDGGTYSASGNLHVVGDSNSNGPELYLQVNNNNTTDNIGALLWGNNTDKTILKIQGDTHTSNTTGDLSFHTSSSGTMAERLRITSGGDVEFSGTAAGVSSVTWDASANSLIFNDNSKAVFGTGSDGFSIYHDGSQSRILENGTGGLRIGSDTGIELNKGTSENMLVCTPDAEVKAYYNNSKKWETTNDGTVTTGVSTATGGFDINADNKSLVLGAGDDFQLYHDGTNNIIRNVGTRLDVIVNSNETAAVFNPNGAVDLYYDNSKKFETTTSGVTVTGTVAATNYTGDGSALTGVGGEFDITSCLFV